MAQSFDPELLAAALVGYQQKLAEIEARMAEIRRQLGGKTASTAVAAATPAPTVRYLSPEARERIAAAQRRRWAAAKGLPVPETAKADAAPSKSKGSAKTAGKK